MDDKENILENGISNSGEFSPPPAGGPQSQSKANGDARGGNNCNSLPPTGGKAADSPAGGELDSQLQKLQSDIAAVEDKYLRTAAELENTRRRASLDLENAARSRTISVAENFLPLLDAIDAALVHHPKNADFISLQKAADGALVKIGIKKVESVGQKLNPQIHNAVQVADASADTPAGTITQELQSGYMLGDTVLRSAMVVVAK